MSKETFHNSDLALSALIDADGANTILLELEEKITDLFGDDAPITKKIREAVEYTGTASDLLFNLGIDNMTAALPFHNWVSDPRVSGPCKSCLHRKESDNPGFGTQCALQGGYFGENYNCNQYEAKE